MDDLPRYRIRPATEADAEDIAALCEGPEDLRQAAPQETAPLTAPVVEHWLRERRAGWVLEDRGAVVAYGELNPADDGPFHWIGHLLVHPRRRGLRLGSRMIGALQSVAFEQLGCRELRISAFEDNPRALRCYRGCGFQPLGRRRVMGRTLVDLRRRDPRRTRLLSRGPAAAAAVLLTLLGVLLLPAAPREWWLDPLGDRAFQVVLAAALLAAPLGALFQPILPSGAARRSDQMLRPMLFGIALGVTVAVAAVLLRFLWQGSLPRGAGDALLDAALVGLQVGLAWGFGLVTATRLRPRLRRFLGVGA